MNVTAQRLAADYLDTVFLVGNIEPTMEWYKRLGFESEYYLHGSRSSGGTPRM